MADDELVESAESGASQTYPQQCSALRKGGNVMIKGRPCKIVEMSTSKTGKHGHAKVHMVGIDLFNGKKLEDICPSTHNMNVPNVTRIDYQLLNIEDNYMSLMTDGGDTRDDLTVPTGEIGNEILEKFKNEDQQLVTILKAMDEEMAVGTKPMTK